MLRFFKTIVTISSIKLSFDILLHVKGPNENLFVFIYLVWRSDGLELPRVPNFALAFDFSRILESGSSVTIHTVSSMKVLSENVFDWTY